MHGVFKKTAAGPAHAAHTAAYMRSHTASLRAAPHTEASMQPFKPFQIVNSQTRHCRRRRRDHILLFDHYRNLVLLRTIINLADPASCRPHPRRTGNTSDVRPGAALPQLGHHGVEVDAAAPDKLASGGLEDGFERRLGACGGDVSATSGVIHIRKQPNTHAAGQGRYTRRSNRPGLSRAESSKSGLLVAARTNTPLRPSVTPAETPSTSASSCATMRSMTPPLSTPLPRAGARASTCRLQLQRAHSNTGGIAAFDQRIQKHSPHRKTRCRADVTVRARTPRARCARSRRRTCASSRV
jgi:hypothetical protein